MSSLPVEYSIAPAPPGRDPYGDRRPPYSEDAEQAVLAAMLIDQDAVMRAMEVVDDSMFYAERHRRLFRSMLSITERGSVIDPLTLADELQRRGDLDGAGGKDYIGFLVDAVPTAANVEYHAKIVKEKALLRRLIEVSTEIVGEAFRGGQTANELLDAAEQKIFQVAQQRTSEGFSRIKELLWPTMERIEAIHAGGESITGIASGFNDLDELTSGFQPSDLIIVAARPSMGKTAFTLNIAQHAAIEKERKVAFFSLEMSKESLVQRMLTSEARIDAQKLRKGMLSDTDFPRRARGGHPHARADLDRRHGGDHPARNALQGAPPQGGSGARHDHRRLPAAHAGAGEQREPSAGSVPDLARSEGAGQGALGAGDRPVAALAGARAARRRQQAAAIVRSA